MQLENFELKMKRKENEYEDQKWRKYWNLSNCKK